MKIYIIIGILALITLWIITTYNKLITFGERVNNAKAQIGTQLESRWDAIKSLIDATKHYSKHEADILQGVTDSRASIGRNSTIADIEKDAEKLDGVVTRLLAVSESYPDLKASEVYKKTMGNIDKYENNVREARMIYNDIVNRYNRKLRVFPSNIIASIFGFKSKDYFQVTESKEEMPSWD